ncbi:MAG: hypothetical protein IT246_07860 [Bacteroidia bacterium]|nr:hypothetical protein [Bacteroidia bacterium]
MKALNRICIYPKDIVRLTGKSERSARMLLSEIKNALNKNQRQFVTIKEFATYAGLPYDEVTAVIE